MGCCSVSAKTVLILISLVFWGVAAAFSYLAYQLFDTFKQYDEINDDQSALKSLAVSGGIVIAIALFMFVIGMLGICGSFSENKCCLVSFFIMVTLVLLLEVTTVVLGAVYQDEIKEGLNKSFQTMVDGYDEKYKETMDDLQQKLKCCGAAKGPSDYKNAPLGVPKSCCPKDDLVCTSLNPDIYNEGCVNKLWDILKENMVYVIAAASVVGFFQLLSLAFSCYLACRRRDVPYGTLNGDKHSTYA